MSLNFTQIKITQAFFIVTLLWCSNVMAQDKYFSTLNVKSYIKQSDKKEVYLVGNWKRFYSEDGWTRLGLDLTLRLKFNPWDLYGGIVSNNTIDKKEPDYWEFRPWLGVSLTNTIYEQLKFNQFFKFEWRNIVFSESSLNKITTRYRYKLKPFYGLKKDWSIFTSFEWYILPNKDLGTRFVSSEEWGLGVSKKIKHYTLILDFTKEWYNKQLQPNSNNGNTLSITLVF